MTQESTAGTQKEFSDGFSRLLADIMFYGFITVIKVIGCYFYMIVIMSIVALLTLVAIVLAGLLAAAVFGKLVGIFVGVLVFSLILVGPFSNWMNLIKTAAKREFFGKS